MWMSNVVSAAPPEHERQLDDRLIIKSGGRVVFVPVTVIFPPNLQIRNLCSEYLDVLAVIGLTVAAMVSGICGLSARGGRLDVPVKSCPRDSQPFME